MIKLSSKGDFKNTTKFLKRMSERKYLDKLDYYGRMGVSALASATPVDTGKTAASWGYTIDENAKGVKITWTNDNLGEGWAPIAILIQYGHATKNGGYVQGRDYINPAIRPIFDDILKNMWREVTNA